MSTQPKRRGPGRALLRIHRRVGVALSGVFILICLTGILLNHSTDLDLNQKRVESNWIYNWYGIEPKGELTHYQFDNQSLSHLSDTLYFNTTPITTFDKPIGVLALENLYIAASPKELALITQEGDLVERLTKQALPTGNILRIQTTDSEIITIETTAGIFQSDQDILSWTPTIWSQTTTSPSPQIASKELQETLLKSFQGEGLSWNRIILDIHSGRFFGGIGKWIADISALGLIFLTLSGIYYTTKYLKKARERNP